MDLTHSTNKSPDSSSDRDTEAPLQTHLTKALSLTLTNGSIKPHHQPPPLPPPQQMVVSYKECLKNHAATLGGLALDGCGEFMPRPNANPLDPTSLKCAACGCHRNFHRRDPNGSFLGSFNTQRQSPPALHWTTSSPSSTPGSTSSGPSQSPTSPAASPTPQSYYSSGPQMLLALSSGHSWPSDDQNNHYQRRPSLDPTALVMINPHGRKRTRTKFTKEQKEKMLAFAEKLGWKMVRGNEEKMVDDFCNEVGVKRNVFKVWMHNNKHRREKGRNHDNVNGDNGDRISCDMTDVYNHNNVSNYDSFHKYQIESKVHVHVSPDGSSPSH